MVSIYEFPDGFSIFPPSNTAMSIMAPVTSSDNAGLSTAGLATEFTVRPYTPSR